METNYVVHIGVILKEHLDAAGMTQKELSQKTGVSTTIINEIIKGKRGMNVPFAKKLQEIFGLPAKYWMDIQGEYDLAVKAEKKKKIIKGDLVELEYTAYEIAERFIAYEREKKERKEYEPSLTQLKLQKLLYLAQKEFIKMGKVLFNDPIYHWEYGPVVATIYERYKGFGASVINDNTKERKLRPDDEVELKKIYKKYEKYTAAYLVELTHKEKAWKETEPNKEITVEKIRESIA